MSEYLYFPGCSLRAAGRAYDESLLALFRLLDLPLTELNDWNCCGATSYMSLDEGDAFYLSARNLSLARRQGGHDLVAPCAACYLVLRKAQYYAEHYPKIRQELNQSLGQAGLLPIDGVRVRHPLEVLANDVGAAAVKERTVRRWTGGKFACYYGCQAVRPFDDGDPPHNPMRMDQLLRAAGFPTVDWALKTTCCGGTLTGTLGEVGIRLNYILLKEAKRKGAEAIVTICPLCQFNLDAYQAQIRRESQEAFDTPVLYFTQLLGWALGADPHSLGFQRSISGRKWIDRCFAHQEALVHA